MSDFQKCKCGQVWSVDHTIYQGIRGGTQVKRFCEKCKITQWGHVTKWDNPVPNERKCDEMS